jgi:hypothetical protein
MASIMDIRAVPIGEPWAMRQHWVAVRSMASLPVASRILVEHLTQVGHFTRPDR